MKKLIYIIVVLIIINSSFLILNCYSQWQPDVRLTNNTSASYTTNIWSIAAIGNVVHVVWFENRDGNYEIYYKRSTDSGLNWGTDTRLTNNTGSSQNPSISLSGSVVHVVWVDNRDGNREIYYKHSTDGGVSWGADTRLTSNTFDSFNPSVAVSGSVVHVVWYDYRDLNYEIYFKRSTDTGVNWGADTRLTNYTGDSYATTVAVSGSVVHVVWQDPRDGNYEIYYKRSTDEGISWGADTRLTNNTQGSNYPSVAISGSVVHVVWYDSRDGNGEIYYKRSTDGGVNWGADARLTNNNGHSEFPSIAVLGSVIHVVWCDESDGNEEIYYKRSIDGGVNWGADTRLTNFNQVSRFPSIAISGTVVHVVWSDSRDGNLEIYYKRDPSGNPINIQNISTEIPSSYSLSQNYPNPFNAETKIKFDIQKSVASSQYPVVSLKVFDLLGREVATLVNESQQPGTYEVEWKASAFASGIYFYQIRTNNFTATKKLILLK